MTLFIGRYRPHRDTRFSKFMAIGLTVVASTLCSFPLAVQAQSGATAPAATAQRTLTLAQAIERAQLASPAIEAANSGVDAAKGSQLQATLYPNPEVSIEAENFGGTGPQRGFGATETTAGVSQLIELGGKRSARQAVALAGRKAAETGVATTLLDLSRDVTVAYTEALAAQDGVTIAKETELAAKQVLDDVTRRVNAARDPLFQRSKAEVAYSTSIVARQNAEQTKIAALQRLARFWGAQSVEDTLVEESLAQPDAPQPLGTYETRLRSAPDLARFQRLRETREAEVRLAEANAVPDITASAKVRQFAGSGSVAFLAGISIPIPVFNQNQGEIARAMAELRRAGQEQRQAEQERSRELVTAWTNWQTAWQEAGSIKNQSLPQAERAFTLALNGYRAGAFEYLEVLDAQRTFFEQRTRYIEVLARLRASRAQTERLAPSLESTNQNPGSNP